MAIFFSVPSYGKAYCLPRKTDSNRPEDWIFLAESDLEVLQMASREEIGHSLCRSKLAEVLEKVLKAELIRLGWPLLKTHDLSRLQGELAQRDAALARAFESPCQDLAEAYFSDRYPGFDVEDPDWPKLREQLRQVEGLLATIKQRL